MNVYSNNANRRRRASTTTDGNTTRKEGNLRRCTRARRTVPLPFSGCLPPCLIRMLHGVESNCIPVVEVMFWRGFFIIVVNIHVRWWVPQDC